MSINLWVGDGRLTRDPASTVFGENMNCQFTIAQDRYAGKNKPKEANFVNITVWGKIAEICADNLEKGRRVLVQGELIIRSYEAKDGSGKRWITEIKAEKVQFLDFKKGNDQTAPAEDFESMGKEVPADTDSEVPF